MTRSRTLTVISAAAVGLAASSAATAAAATPGNRSSFGPDISADGRFVVFASDATNLVTGDTNGRRDVFIRDTRMRTTRLVSKGLNGKLANQSSYNPGVSDDGRYVSFTSDASNLTAGDTNGKRDVFRADLVTGKTIRVSVSSTGAQGNGASQQADMSANGSSIVFLSAATNLTVRDTNGVDDVFLRDVATNTTRRISIAPTSDQLLSPSSSATISDNGTVIGFEGPSGIRDAIYRWNRGTGKTTLLAEDQVGSPVASNGGVSYADGYYRESCSSSMVEITASPVSESFTISNEDCSGSSDYSYDVSKWGAVAAIPTYNYYQETLELLVLDDDYQVQSYPGEYPAVRARLPVLASSVRMSSDGAKVAFTTVQSGISQVKVWTWATGAVETISVR
ncbi:MAG: PD40 domain-containing protein [Austwickia sp.]|nr:PD40 domain-containing protein [Austwickia sp.]